MSNTLNICTLTRKRRADGGFSAAPRAQLKLRNPDKKAGGWALSKLYQKVSIRTPLWLVWTFSCVLLAASLLIYILYWLLILFRHGSAEARRGLSFYDGGEEFPVGVGGKGGFAAGGDYQNDRFFVYAFAQAPEGFFMD